MPIWVDTVWAGAHSQELMKLDKFQVEAMRLVTGCTKRSNIANLYYDCGWESLNDRRAKHILKMIYRIDNNMAPSYLKRILPNKVKDVVPYPVRDSENFLTINRRTKSFKSSFIPYGTGLWNKLDLDIRNSVSLGAFNHALNNKFNTKRNTNSNKLFSMGKRNINVIHSRLRVGCSQLKSDLHFNLIELLTNVTAAAVQE